MKTLKQLKRLKHCAVNVYFICMKLFLCDMKLQGFKFLELYHNWESIYVFGCFVCQRQFASERNIRSLDVKGTLAVGYILGLCITEAMQHRLPKKHGKHKSNIHSERHTLTTIRLYGLLFVLNITYKRHENFVFEIIHTYLSSIHWHHRVAPSHNYLMMTIQWL